MELGIKFIANLQMKQTKSFGKKDKQKYEVIAENACSCLSTHTNILKEHELLTANISLSTKFRAH